MYKSILVKLGLRSACCGAKVATWHANKFYCTACEGWLDRVKQSVASTRSNGLEPSRSVLKHV